MYNRRVLAPIALVGAFGIALTPTLASASTSGPAATSTVGSPVAKQAAGAAAPGYRYTTTKATSVFHRGSATSPNQGMFVNLSGWNTETYSVHFEADLVGLVSGTGTVTINWGDTSSDTQTVTAPTQGGQLLLEFPHTYAKLGIYEVTIEVTDQQGDTATNALEVETGSEFVPTTPTRILDTRTLGAGGIAAQGIYGLKVVGAGAPGATIPAGVTAVVLNITATEATGNGFLTAYADDSYAPYAGKLTAVPESSSLNFRANQNVANLVIAPVGADGTVDIYNGSPNGSVHVIADVAGYFTTSVQDSYVGVGPSRILDTRSGLGSAKAPIGAGKTLNVTVAGGTNVVPADATAVVLHLTTVDSTRNGLLTAYPAGTNQPNVSSLNYGQNETISNMAVVPVGEMGQISIENNSAGSTDVIADIAGYFTKNSGTGTSSYIPFWEPFRYIDSRPTINQRGPFVGPLNTGVIYGYPMSTTATAVVPDMVANATIVSPTGNGVLSLLPDDLTVPTTSNLNYLAGQTVAGLAFVAANPYPSGTNYETALYANGQGGSYELILDEFGEFME